MSFLTEVEFISAVAKKVRLQDLDSVDGQRILAKFTAHVEAGLFRMIPVEKHHYRLARGWLGLLTTPLRTLEAPHLANASCEELPLVTSDTSFFQAARMLDLEARLLA